MRIRVDLWPGGDKRIWTRLGEFGVANITPHADPADYTFALWKPDSASQLVIGGPLPGDIQELAELLDRRDPPSVVGRVLGHHRSDGWAELLRRVLMDVNYPV